jgi:hypothetical protein
LKMPSRNWNADYAIACVYAAGMSRESWLFLFAGIGALWALVQLFSKAMGLLPQITRMSWAIPGVVLCLLLSGWGFYRSLHMVPRFDEKAEQEPIEGKTFVNEAIVIDGKAFNECKFYNVSFVIKGEKPFSVTNCHFFGRPVIKTGNPALSAILALEMGMGLLPKDMKIEGLRNVEPPKEPPPPP